MGALQYISLTMPDLTFSVNKACQFMASPLDAHWYAIRRILRYLTSTISHGLLLSPSLSDQKFSLRIYNDSDWASDPDD